MKLDRRTLIIGVQTLLIIGLSWALVFLARDEWRAEGSGTTRP